MIKSKILPKMGKLFVLVLLLLASTPAFAQSVDTAWVRRYDGLENSYDRATAIAVDDSGNVYVTGESVGAEMDSDYVTIKYYSNGDTAWVRRYSGSGNSDDYAYGIVVDATGNVYVTGRSGSFPNSDYATIKYNTNGDTTWVRRYNGTGDYYDRAEAIAVDSSGNVYLSGVSYGSGTDGDFATIKYYPNGDTAWVRRYNGPGNYYDRAYDIAVDGSGNVYVSGWSYGDETNYDYASIKYNSNGVTTWVKRYNGPGNYRDGTYEVAVDNSGNAYVSGPSFGSGTDYDYATIKYYPNGDTAWVRRYNGLGNNYDWATSMAVDDSGNVYVTGVSVGIEMDSDYVTIKYYPNGDTAWVRRYNGPENYNDRAEAIAVDSSGNVYVTGYSYGSGTNVDYATIKYYPDGDTAWVRRYNGPGNGGDESYAIAVDASGNVCVTGKSYGSGTFDYATIKYVQFLCGDVNKDGIVELGDLVYLITYLYKSGPAPVPVLHAGDANCDEVVDLGDIVYLITYLYKSGPAPCC